MRIGFRGVCVPSVTLLANEFIDHYMPSANGEYVKVYLYLLRHQGEEISTAGIADALELTEGDVRRALQRWERDGLIGQEESGQEAAEARGKNAESNRRERSVMTEESRFTTTAEQYTVAAAEHAAVEEEEAAEGISVTGSEQDTSERQAEEVSHTISESPAVSSSQKESREYAGTAAEVHAAVLPDKSGVDFQKLRQDEEFAGLLYIIQRYLSKIFSQTDSETIAYLYDVLQMPPDLLVYLAELCAQNQKTSLRYFESIALDWYRRGIRTVEQAKESGSRYTSEVYAVMKAFGMNGRDPGTEELKLIRKWFGQYGFTKEMVLLACGRTLMRIQKPSFPYTDKILTEWKNAGIHTVEDANRLEEQHSARKTRNGGTSKTGAVKTAGTRFSNFEQRDDDIDALAMQLMKQKLGQG